MNSTQLVDIIKELISLNKEGVYWDFKQEYHKNNVNLVHDIICLANAKHDGNRYLIFGVSDACKAIGISSSTLIKQANIIDNLRNSKFADDIFPDIVLEHITIENKDINVLIIKQTTNKPYYLTQEKKENKKIINAGTIYTRVMDTNTPKNRVASSKDIEQMWKERFGLIQTPLDRFKIYLNNFDEWEHRGEISFYKQYPELTIQPLDDDTCQGCETREWARGEIGYCYDTGNGASLFGFYYNATLLKKVCCVQFNGGEKYIVNPDWEAIGKGRIYFYLEDSFDYAYQIFLIKKFKQDFSKNLMFKNGNFDIPVFSNKKELFKFIDYSKIKLKINEKFIIPENNMDKQNKLFYSFINLYIKWKNNNK